MLRISFTLHNGYSSKGFKRIVVTAFHANDTTKYRHGAQGPFDTASHAMLDNEFGTHKDEDVIIQILEKGTIQETIEGERQGVKNDSQGAMANHS